MDENILIHKLIEIFQYKNEYQLETSNIQPQDMYVLERIFLNNKLLVKELSKNYSIPPSTLTGIIDRLEKKNLIKRLRTNSDRRAIELILTKEGEIVLENHVKEDKVFAANLFNTLANDKKEKLLSLLEELLGKVNKDALFTNNE